jgi:hypothetical protein
MMDELKYPVAAAMINPVTSPRNTEADFMNAEPQISLVQVRGVSFAGVGLLTTAR